jgi:hypothetical protein
LPLAAPAAAGNTSILLDSLVDWSQRSEIVISPTDDDPHEAEIRIIKSVVVMSKQTLLFLTIPLEFSHYSEEWILYSTKE